MLKMGSFRHTDSVAIANNEVIPAEAGIYKNNYRRELVSGFRRKDKPKPKNGIATQSGKPESRKRYTIDE
jgi:hypothetical protein